MKKPEFRKVKFSQLRGWSQNPRQATKDNVIELAKQIDEVGLFKNFVCWQEPVDKKRRPETFTVGGGNIRLAAMTMKKVSPDEDVLISLNFPETHAEKIRLSILDNMNYGSYVEQQLAELSYGVKDDPALSGLKVSFSAGVDIKEIIDSYGPSEYPEQDITDVETSHECPKCGFKW